jgi:hypothetical protein
MYLFCGFLSMAANLTVYSAAKIHKISDFSKIIA